MAYGKSYNLQSSGLSSRILVLCLVIGFVVIVVLQHLGFFGGVARTLRSFVNDAVTQSDLSIGSNMPSTYKGLLEHTRALQERVNELEHWQMAALSLSERLVAYENILNIAPVDLFSRIVTAQIITKTQGPFAHTYLIGAGRDQGVQPFGIVVNDKGLVGRITTLGKQSARVLLVKDFNSRIPVYGADSKQQAIMYGGQEGFGSLRDLPSEGKFLQGEAIFTSGAGGVFPRGLIVGHVDILGKAQRVKFAMSSSHIGHVLILPAHMVFLSETDQVNESENLPDQEQESAGG